MRAASGALVVLLMATMACCVPADTMDQAEGPGRPAAEDRRAKPSGADTFADALLRQGLGGLGGQAGFPAFVARNYKKMAQTILPLLVGFKATGMLVIALAVTKFILLKALFLSTTALLVAAVIALKKLLSSGQPHDSPVAYTFQQHDLSHVPYLQHPHAAAAAEFMEASHNPQVTYIGGSYGLQSMPYGATAAGAAGLVGSGLGAAEDPQGLYSSAQSAVATLSQLQQLQQLQQHALLAQQLGNATTTPQQQQPAHPQAGHLLHLSRRRLNVPQGGGESNPYPYQPARTALQA